MKALVLLAGAALAALAGCSSPEGLAPAAKAEAAPLVSAPRCDVTEADRTPLPAQCGGQLTFVASDWTDSELAAMQAAASSWNALIGFEYFALAEVDAEQELCHVGPAELAPHELALWGALGTMMVDRDQVRASSDSDRFQTVMEHELGHSLGMTHAASGVMCSNVWTDATFTASDRAQCQTLGVCR